MSRAAKRGVSNGGFPNLDLSFLFCPFLSFWDLPDFSGIFPICSGMVRGMFRGFSRLVLFLFLGLFTAPTRNSPERVCDTIWTFPEKSGKPPGMETPCLASLKNGREYHPNTNDGRRTLFSLVANSELHCRGRCRCNSCSRPIRITW